MRKNMIFVLRLHQNFLISILNDVTIEFIHLFHFILFLLMPLVNNFINILLWVDSDEFLWMTTITHLLDGSF